MRIVRVPPAGDFTVIESAAMAVMEPPPPPNIPKRPPGPPRQPPPGLVDDPAPEPVELGFGVEAADLACVAVVGAREALGPLAALAIPKPAAAIEPASNAPTPPRIAHPRTDVISQLEHV